ncbi:MAG: Fe-S cluster assembly protein SufD [Nevskia sp.]|nr:Fe-S cluster assembly protein SufD [Nevskia sp.]
MSAAYQQAFERFSGTLDRGDRDRRQARFERFAGAGFPGPHEERWRYTDISGLAAREFALPAAADIDLGETLLAGCDHLVYVNGYLDRTRSTAAALHGVAAAEGPDDDGIAALNAAFDGGGLQLRLASGETLPRPLNVVAAIAAPSAPGMVHQRHRIELGENSQATVVFQFAGRGGERLATQRVEIRLAPGARLMLYRVEDEAAGGTLLSTIQASLARASTLRAVTVDCGGGLARHDFNIALDGAGAEAALAGLYRPQAGGHVDNHAQVVHAAPHCRSRMLFRGIVDARTRAVLNGRVVVQPGAQKTDSEQRIANLLLSPRAEVDAKPELEIYADDVKCAHGATVGRIDETALGYLRSRGIDAGQARALLLRAFAGEVLARIGLPALRAALNARLGFPAEEPIEP